MILYRPQQNFILTSSTRSTQTFIWERPLHPLSLRLLQKTVNPWQISKRVFQENKACQIFWRTNLSYSLIRTRTFFRKFGVLCFLQTPVLRFALLPYYRRNWSQAFREGFLEKTLYFFIWSSPLGIYFFFFKSLKPI